MHKPNLIMVHVPLMLEVSAHCCWPVAVLGVSAGAGTPWKPRGGLWMMLEKGLLCTHSTGVCIHSTIEPLPRYSSCILLRDDCILWRYHSTVPYSTSKQDCCLSPVLTTLIWCWAVFLLTFLLVRLEFAFQKGVLPEMQKWPRGGGCETVSLGKTCASSSALFLKFYMFLRVITELYVRLWLA